ncbi:hypothetical protein V6N11_012669 [Hibiscus sabdariffa]|uniref:Secreted protein n=1 Tax=Hibiscus sabdariffa TaxID=183260 RepID=A0ABR2QBX9_9ROSI
MCLLLGVHLAGGDSSYGDATSLEFHFKYNGGTIASSFALCQRLLMPIPGVPISLTPLNIRWILLIADVSLCGGPLFWSGRSTPFVATFGLHYWLSLLPS